MSLFIFYVFLVFSILGVLFIPFSFKHLPIQQKITKLVFADLIADIASKIEFIKVNNTEISSDSSTLYLLVFILLGIAILFVALISFVSVSKRKITFMVQNIQLFLVFYLSLVMFMYGFDKIFKAQFYLPEPNTLYTPLGMLEKDLLFWSTMGSSYSYTVFLGFAELLSALFLLHRKTRNFGLFLLFGILLNVVMINLSFDISVKLYSFFLLIVCFLLLVSSVKQLMAFFVFNKSAKLTQITSKNLKIERKTRIYMKIIVVVLIFTESLLPYIKNSTYNDDAIPRNYMHGAYKVMKIQNRNANKNNFSLNVKRIFIHRKNYFIMQYEDDTAEDFYLEINQDKKEFILTNYEGVKMILKYNYSENSSTLQITFIDLNVVIDTKSLPWKKLPLLQPLFHWTVDEIK